MLHKWHGSYANLIYQWKIQVIRSKLDFTCHLQNMSSRQRTFQSIMDESKFGITRIMRLHIWLLNILLQTIVLKDQLNLKDNQVSFFTYHGVADENHFHNLEKALNHPKMNMDVAKKIVKTAKATAKLYKMQLEELGNY